MRNQQTYIITQGCIGNDVSMRGIFDDAWLSSDMEGEILRHATRLTTSPFEKSPPGRTRLLDRINDRA